MNTFDVFDTLIARRCVDPLQIFAQLEQRVALPGLAEDRVRAERACPIPHTIDDIYARLAEMRGLDVAQAEEIKAQEIALEFENVIPIRENMARVKDGDVVVSDMYLPAQTILELLRRAGLDKNVGIYVSNNGKSTGVAWTKLKAIGAIGLHLGDNPEGDVAAPRRHGVRALHTDVSKFDVVESWLWELGLKQVAQAVRTARLTSFDADPIVRMLQCSQYRFNFPLLLFATAHLVRTIKDRGLNKVLFMSRDAFLWSQMFALFNRQYGLEIETHYFYTSRIAKLSGSESYLRYMQQCITEGSIVVDLCGTGMSTQIAMDAAGVSAPLYLACHIPPETGNYLGLENPNICDPIFLFRPQEPLGRRICPLEMSNYAREPQLRDVRLLEGSAVPVYCEEVRSPLELRLVGEQHAAFRHVLAALEGDFPSYLIDLDSSILTKLGAHLFQAMSEQTLFPTVFPSHFVEDAINGEDLIILDKKKNAGP